MISAEVWGGGDWRVGEGLGGQAHSVQDQCLRSAEKCSTRHTSKLFWSKHISAPLKQYSV